MSAEKPGARPGSDSLASDDTSVTAPTDTSTPVEVVAKAGNVRRVTFTRTAVCTCTGCPATFDSTGTAASHARAARHVVTVNYQTAFSFVPAELLPTAWTTR